MVGHARYELSYSRADAKRLLVILLAFEILLVLTYCVVHIFLPDLKWGPIKVFVDLDREATIPTWLSAIQLFAVGTLFLLHAPASKQLRPYFVMFGLAFVFLSMDEAAAIHEKIIDSAKRIEWQWLLLLTFMGNQKAWMVPYVIIGLLALFFSYRCLALLWRNARQELLWLTAGMAIFCVGGIGLELLTFTFEEAPSDDAPYAWVVAGEEFLEMAGMSIVLYGTLLLGISIQGKTLREWKGDVTMTAGEEALLDNTSRNDPGEIGARS